MNTKEWYGGDGYTPEGEWQCGEHTFEQTINAVPDPVTGEYDILWRFFVTPVWGDGRYDIPEEEPYPNAIAATGIDRQPLYDGLVDDCGARSDGLVNFPATGVQDGINFTYTPYCIQPGEPFFVAVFTHLLSAPVADLHVNLQIGTGPDKYLGPDDIFVAKSVEFGIPRDVDAIWSRHLSRFTGRATAKLVGYSTPYLTAFLVPAGSTFDPSIPGGWPILEREYFLNLQFCDVAVSDGPSRGSDSDGGSNSGSGCNVGSGSGVGGDGGDDSLGCIRF
eukprot:TRINITY_DN3869_c0_g1_i1.p1 TRINITY_DN3869_c0_g1~~TRINITY_DN3869_c0_g1_i1.p1  ORF type:complete len:277 (-),score=63.54 TRINITY_DN3869_c0_g1_i1:265-1095(-)